MIGLSKRLLYLGSILSLLNIIELVSKTIKVLCLNNCVNMITAISFLSESMILWHFQLIIDHTWVNLLKTWLVLERLPVSSNMLWCPWCILLLVMYICSNAKICAFSAHCYHSTSCSNIGNRIHST